MDSEAAAITEGIKENTNADATASHAQTTRLAPTAKLNAMVLALSVALAFVFGLFLGSLLPQWRPYIVDNGLPAVRPVLRDAPAEPARAQTPIPATSDAQEQPRTAASSASAPAAQPSAETRQPEASSAQSQDVLALRIATLEQAVLEQPGNAELWTGLGNLYFDSGQTRRAVTAYERSLALQPDNADVLTDLGIMYREMGEFDKAVTNFRRAAALNPRHENALFNEGVVLYFDLHMKDEAKKAWQNLLKINPEARTPDGRPVADLVATMR